MTILTLRGGQGKGGQGSKGERLSVRSPVMKRVGPCHAQGESTWRNVASLLSMDSRYRAMQIGSSDHRTSHSTLRPAEQR